MIIQDPVGAPPLSEHPNQSALGLLGWSDGQTVGRSNGRTAGWADIRSDRGIPTSCEGLAGITRHESPVAEQIVIHTGCAQDSLQMQLFQE